MHNILPIYRKELKSYFNSAIAYIVIVVFLLIAGWFFTSNMFLINVATMRIVFEIIPLIFLFFVPAITMRSLSEEKKSGTLELLVTKPVKDIEIIAGKFLAAWTLMAIALVPTFVYWITIGSLGSLDNGPVIGGYIGLLLMGGVYIGIGVFASSLTENQVVAFIIAFLIVFVFFMFDKILIYVPEGLTSIVEYLGVDYHFSNIARGVIDSRDIFYYLSAITFTLLMAKTAMESRKW
jgi:ABC-2 type transport system permease protein